MRFKTSRPYKYELYECLRQNRRVLSVPILAPPSMNGILETQTLSEVVAKTVTAEPATVMSQAWPCHGTVINREGVLLVSLESVKRLLLSA
jgi:hypothetical protein